MSDLYVLRRIITMALANIKPNGTQSHPHIVSLDRPAPPRACSFPVLTGKLSGPRRSGTVRDRDRSPASGGLDRRLGEDQRAQPVLAAGRRDRPAGDRGDELIELAE